MAMFVEKKGNAFSYAGKKLVLRGIGVGSWLNLEHFMVGLPGIDGMIRSALEARMPGTIQRFTSCFFTDEDAAYLTSLGVNFIRVPFAHSLVFDDQSGCFKPEGLAVLKRLGETCDRYGIFFMPDLHTVPGGQNPDWHSGNATGIPQFWLYKTFRDQAAMIWQEVACVLRDSTHLLGYDLLNEPVLPSEDKTLLNEFHHRAAEAIRRVDPDHLLLIEGGKFAMDFRGIELPDPERSAYTYHFYPTVWDATLEDTKLTDEQRLQGLRTAHDHILETMEGYQGPLLCGETGCELQTLGDHFGLSILKQTVQVFEEHDASWCLWSYKDTGMMGLVCPAENTAWHKLAGIISASWTHHQDMQRGDRLARTLAAECFGSLTEDEIYRSQFIIRAILFPLEVSHILTPALMQLTDEEALRLGEDFALSRCTRRTLYEQFMKQHTGGCAEK